MKTIGLLPQQQLIQIAHDDVSDEFIRALFGLDNTPFQRVPFEDTPRPESTSEGEWIEAPYEWLEDRVRRVWIFRNWSPWEVFQRAVQDGYLVQPEGFVLALEDDHRSQFNQMLALIKEALDLGMITNETPQSVAGKDGLLHELTTLRFRQVMVQYGLYYKTLWDAAKQAEAQA